MLHPIDLSRADLNLLVLFETVMRERHVGRSAESLNLSPSAVSHGLARLRALLNDPLFIKTPKGVTPTDRAVALDAPVAEILARIRGVVSVSAPFEPRTSTRVFTIAAPDGVSEEFLLGAVQRLQREAPGVDLRLRQLLPRQGETEPQSVWRDAFSALDARAMDLAILPVNDAPPRFWTQVLYEEEFVVAARAEHAWIKKPSLAGFCAAGHVVVSSTGDAYGFVDAALAERGLARRVALTVPHFMMTLALLAQTDFLAAVPRRFFARHGRRFRLAGARPPLPLPCLKVNMVAPKPALQDAGLQWLVGVVAQVSGGRRRRRGKE